MNEFSKHRSLGVETSQVPTGESFEDTKDIGKTNEELIEPSSFESVRVAIESELGIQVDPKVLSMMQDKSFRQNIEEHFSLFWHEFSLSEQYRLTEGLAKHSAVEINDFLSKWLANFWERDRYQALRVMLEAVDSRVFEYMFQLIRKAPEQIFEEDPWSGGAATYQANPESGYIRVLLERFTKLHELTSEAQSYVQENALTKNSEKREQLGQQVVQMLHERANKFLKQHLPKALESWDYLKELNRQYATFNKNMELIVATIRAVVKEGGQELKDILSKMLEEKSGAELSEKEVEQMQSIFTRNRDASYPERLFQQTVSDFLEHIREAQKSYVLLKSGPDILAFFHYEPAEDGSLYVGSLNLNPDAKDTPVVAGIAKSIIEELGKRADLTAIVRAENPARLYYKQALGFKEEGVIEDYKGTGEKYIKLRRRQVLQPSEKEQKAA